MMRIVDLETGEDVIRFEKNKPPFFANQIMLDGFARWGLAIPFSERRKYQGKASIHPDEPQFEKAFMEFYYAYEMDHNLYKLMKD